MNSYNGFSGEQRLRALDWINAEYRAGRRKRPTRCEACGQTEGAFDAHSEDYSSPFGPHIGRFSLCFVCHLMIHGRGRSPAAWDHYRALVREGWRTIPVSSRNLGFVNKVQGVLNRASAPLDDTGLFRRGDPPVRLVLDAIAGDKASGGGPFRYRVP